MSEVLTRADVERIAALARLELTAEEVTLFAAQLTNILGYADQIQQVDTSNVPAASVTTPSETVFRDDQPAGSLPRDLLLGEAPAADPAAGLFKVPRVLGS
jgi:aspartyl-tRNA(Asn)/glutamyl-tRNA(Gln) amidotransferase subunit C